MRFSRVCSLERIKIKEKEEGKLLNYIESVGNENERLMRQRY